MSEIAISIIYDFLMDYEDPSYQYWRRKFFKKQSYAVWACQELIFLVKANRRRNPIPLIQNFADKMERFSKIRGSDDNPFEVALYVANNVIDTLRATM